MYLVITLECVVVVMLFTNSRHLRSYTSVHVPIR